MEGLQEEAPEELDPSDEMICVLLVQGRTHSQVAAELGISTKTIQRRLQQKWFADEVKGRRRAAVAATAASLEQLASDAVSALSGLLTSDNEQIRLRAIDMVLKSGRQFHREDVVEGEILERLEAIEAAGRFGRRPPRTRMRRSIHSRIRRAERALRSRAATQVTDWELRQAMTSRQLHHRHLENLYQRIRKPFAASVIISAWSCRVRRQLWGQQVQGELDGSLYVTSRFLSYPVGAHVPSYVGDQRVGVGPIRLPDGGDTSLCWPYDVRRWLAERFIQECGGTDVVRSVVERLYEAGDVCSIAPVLSTEQAVRMVGFIKELEPELPLNHHDQAVLLWLHQEGRWCISQHPNTRWEEGPERVDIGGQTWTRGGSVDTTMAQVRDWLSDPDGQQPDEDPPPGGGVSQV